MSANDQTFEIRLIALLGSVIPGRPKACPGIQSHFNSAGLFFWIPDRSLRERRE
jgi:hypothetical protein